MATVGGSAITKTIALDASWATGVNSLAGNATYHLWVIKNAKGMIDMMATRDDDSEPTPPEGYEIVPSPFQSNRALRRKRQRK